MDILADLGPAIGTGEQVQQASSGSGGDDP